MIQGSIIWIAWPVLAAPVAFWQMRRHARWPHMLGAVALATYVWWICSVAFFPLPLPGAAESMTRAGGSQGLAWVNLIPIRELVRTLPRLPAGQIIRQFGGNILLFVPFTLVGPLLWARLRTWWWPLLAGVGGSLAIELIQLALSGIVGYPYRQTDVDDVILNAFGALLGYVVFLAARALSSLLSRRMTRNQ